MKYDPRLDNSTARNNKTVSENFSNWFGKSSVKNEDNQPEIFYHGTNADIDKFDKKKIGSNFSSDERGFFFINSTRIASAYASDDDSRHEGINVVPVYLSIQKPLVIDDKFLASERMNGLGPDNDVITFWDCYQSLILNWVDEGRHDGVILVDTKSTAPGEPPIKMAVAFEPHQIKSAFNNGLYVQRSAEITDFQAMQKIDAAVSAKKEIEKHQQKKTLSPV